MVDRLEPHGYFTGDLGPDHDRAVRGGWGGVYPGWGAGWGTGRVLYLVLKPEVDLRLIHGILRTKRFIRPFDCILYNIF